MFVALCTIIRSRKKKKERKKSIHFHLHSKHIDYLKQSWLFSNRVDTYILLSPSIKINPSVLIPKLSSEDNLIFLFCTLDDLNWADKSDSDMYVNIFTIPTILYIIHIPLKSLGSSVI